MGQLWQCGAVRREGNDVLRCGRPSIHVEQGTEHGDWVTIGALDPAHHGIPLGRILDALWHGTSTKNPDAWRDPDPAGRSVEPPTPGKIPPGVEVIPAGRAARGEGMATVAELKAAALAIKEELQVAAGLMENANNIVSAQGGQAQAVLGDSVQDVAQAVIWRCSGTEQNLDDALSNINIAIGQLEMFAGMA
jgi:hypothetical protein